MFVGEKGDVGSIYHLIYIPFPFRTCLARITIVHGAASRISSSIEAKSKCFTR